MANEPMERSSASLISRKWESNPVTREGPNRAGGRWKRDRCRVARVSVWQWQLPREPRLPLQRPGNRWLHGPSSHRRSPKSPSRSLVVQLSWNPVVSTGRQQASSPSPNSRSPRRASQCPGRTGAGTLAAKGAVQDQTH